MTESLLVHHPYFHWRLPSATWQRAQPPENVDAKFVAPDGQHELFLGILLAPSEPARASERLQRTTQDFLTANTSSHPSQLVESHMSEDPGPTNEAGYVLDYGATILRRRVVSVLATPGAFGEHGRFQVLANVALYSHGPAGSDGARRFEDALRGLEVAPAMVARGLGALPEQFDHAALVVTPVHRRELDVYARLLAARGIADATRGLLDLGHDVYGVLAHRGREMPRMLGMVLEPDVARAGLSYAQLLARAIDNVMGQSDRLVGQRHFMPSGQPVIVFHGWHLGVSAMLVPSIQESLVQQLGSATALACFPRPDLAAVFPAGSREQRDEARAFVMQGAGEITLSSEIFALDGRGGARAAS